MSAIAVNRARRSGVLRVVYWLGVILSLYLFYYYLLPAGWAVLKFVLPLFTPFYIGILLAALIDPLVELGTRRLKLGRGWVVLLILLFLMGAIGLLITLGVLRLIVELTKLSALLPGYSQATTTYVRGLLTQAQSIYATFDLPPQVLERVEGVVNASLNTLTEWSLQAFNWFLNFLSSLPNALLILVFTLMATYFFSRDKERIRLAIYSLFSPEWQAKIDFVGNHLGSALMGFVRAYTILISIAMLQTIIGLLILGVNYAVLITVVVGVADLLPILGPGTVFIPWAIILFAQGAKGLAIGLLILYALVMVVREILQPKVVADNVGMHPLEALVSIFAGLKVIGVWGLILGPLFLVVIKAAIWAGVWERRARNG